jgi:hypothetical protein
MRHLPYSLSLLLVAFTVACSRAKVDHLPMLLPLADHCYCTLHYEVKESLGNLVMGDAHLVVRNDGARACEVALPNQRAQALLPSSAQGFDVHEQSGKSVAPGQSVTFLVPFAMSPDYLRAEDLLALRVDGTVHMVGLVPEGKAPPPQKR